MKDLYKRLQDSFKKYSGAKNVMNGIYGLDDDANYDLIIVAPSWKPEKIFVDIECSIDHVKSGPYFNGYVVTIKGYKIGYIQASSGASNVLDCCLTLGHGQCQHVLFIGAVGALKDDLKLGDIVIPKYSIAGEGASLYLKESITTDNFLKLSYPNAELTAKLESIANEQGIELKRKVIYSTDSIYCEYAHLPQILELGAECIEMETAVFFRCMELMNKKGTALLCVSDNSAMNQHLVGRTDEETAVFHMSRSTRIPNLIISLLENL